MRGALPNDVTLCLRCLGFTDRTIAGGKVTVGLDQVEPWFLARMGGITGVKNPMLLRGTLGGE